MSTRNHILYANGIELYEEMSEPQKRFGKHAGFNLYFLVEADSMKSLLIKDGYVFLELISNDFPQTKFKIWCNDTLKIDYDYDGLCIVVKGGTKSESHFSEKELTFFNF